MKILIMLIIISLSLFTSNVYAWEPPLECADKNREIQGNRTSPCKLVLPELTEIEYRVRLDYPNCVEELAFHMPGISYPEQGIERGGILAVVNRAEYSKYDRYAYVRNDWKDQTVEFELKDNVVLAAGETFTFNSRVTSGSKLGNPTPELPNMALEFEITYTGGIESFGWRHYVRVSNALLRPGTDSKMSLVNSCLALLVQEKRDREHAEQLRQEEAEKQAELLAQREAELKAQEQARREAEQQASKARIADRSG